jgi:hypothetical protein
VSDQERSPEPPAEESETPYEAPEAEVVSEEGRATTAAWVVTPPQ